MFEIVELYALRVHDVDVPHVGDHLDQVSLR